MIAYLRNRREDFHLYHKYMREIEKYPVLSSEEQSALLEKAVSGDERAINRLVCANQKFVIKVAFLYIGQGLSITEIINEGNIGLIEAIRRYDINKKVKFLSYAVWWIRQAIVQAIFQKSRTIRLSASNELKLRRLKKQRFYLNQLKTEKNANQEIFSEEQVDKLLTMDIGVTSLDAPTRSDGDYSLIDKITDSSITPEEQADKLLISHFIEKNMKKLTKMEKTVLINFYGLNANRPLTLREIGDIHNLSKERIRQIRESALAKLRSKTIEAGYSLAA